MTTRPADSVFDLPEPHRDVEAEGQVSHMKDHEESVAEEAQQPTEAQWVNTELHAIASTIADLQSRLEQANSRLSSVEKVETTEYEIGRLFVEAQRFSEASLSKLELKVHEVLVAAEEKARQILAEATEEAQEIRRQAQNAAFASAATVRELQAAIAGFTTVNAELLEELGTLNGMLSPGKHQEASEVDASAAAGLPRFEAD